MSEEETIRWKAQYEGLNINIPKGALLLGMPGVGKTFIARAMAGELQEAFEIGRAHV